MPEIAAHPDPVGFHLLEPPTPPTAMQWTDILRWLVAVMDNDDKSLGFVASLLHHARDHGGLTEKQALHAGRIWDAHLGRYHIGTLESQQT